MRSTIFYSLFGVVIIFGAYFWGRCGLPNWWAHVIFLLIPLAFILWVQSIFSSIAKRILKEKWVRWEVVRILPSLLLAGYLWYQPRAVFKIATGTAMPGSVRGFVFHEDAWTDYTVVFHCRISPDDFRLVVERGGFARVKYTLATKANIVPKTNRWGGPEFIDPIVYGRGPCRLVTDQNHERMFGVYSVD